MVTMGQRPPQQPAAEPLLSPAQLAGASQHSLQPSALPPLIPPSVLLIGDSVVKNVRFGNTITHCVPGAKVIDIIQMLPGILDLHSASLRKIIVHVGFNDTAHQQSEQTKADFLQLFDLLKSTGKIIFISGPIPKLSRAVGRFSRILSLHTWLQSICRTHNLGFIHNFDLFWNRSSFFSRDGVHPNRLGSRMLAVNMQYIVLHSTHD